MNKKIKNIVIIMGFCFFISNAIASDINLAPGSAGISFPYATYNTWVSTLNTHINTNFQAAYNLIPGYMSTASIDAEIQNQLTQYLLQNQISSNLTPIVSGINELSCVDAAGEADCNNLYSAINSAMQAQSNLPTNKLSSIATTKDFISTIPSNVYGWMQSSSNANTPLGQLYANHNTVNTNLKNSNAAFDNVLTTGASGDVLTMKNNVTQNTAAMSNASSDVSAEAEKSAKTSEPIQQMIANSQNFISYLNSEVGGDLDFNDANSSLFGNAASGYPGQLATVNDSIANAGNSSIKTLGDLLGFINQNQKTIADLGNPTSQNSIVNRLNTAGVIDTSVPASNTSLGGIYNLLKEPSDNIESDTPPSLMAQLNANSKAGQSIQDGTAVKSEVTNNASALMGHYCAVISYQPSVTDYSALLTSAIKNCEGQLIKFSAGTFNFSDTKAIAIPSNTEIEGSGKDLTTLNFNSSLQLAASVSLQVSQLQLNLLSTPSTNDVFDLSASDTLTLNSVLLNIVATVDYVVGASQTLSSTNMNVSLNDVIVPTVTATFIDFAENPSLSAPYVTFVATNSFINTAQFSNFSLTPSKFSASSQLSNDVLHDLSGYSEPTCNINLLQSGAQLPDNGKSGCAYLGAQGK